MNHPPPPDDPGSSSAHSAWLTTTPSKFFEDPIPPRRVPALPHPRRKPQALSLTPQAHVWIASLPPQYQPLATARAFPHIVNRLSEMWRTPAELPAHLSDLMLSTRPEGREGFPFQVLSELADLQGLLDQMKSGGKR